MTHKYVEVGATYFDDAFGDPDTLGENAIRCLNGVSVDFDTMVGMGLSGSLVVPVLARLFDVNFAIVRKEYSSHDHSEIVGRIGHRWIFVDDFICSGQTLQRVKNVMDVTKRGSFRLNDLKYVGSYEYQKIDYETSKKGQFIPSLEGLDKDG